MMFSRIFNRFVLTTALVLATAAPVLRAQENSEEPDAASPAAAVGLPQSSTITSTNNTIQATRLPVTFGGKIYYVDLTLALGFEVSAKGLVTATVKPTAVPSANPLTANFKAGTYIGPADVNGDKSIIVIAGPSPLQGGGSAWTLTTNAASSASTYPDTAVWYVESIANNPLASRLKLAEISSTAYSYGIGDSGSDPAGEWPNNAILGFYQVGNTLTISSFTTSNCCGTNDHATAADEITYMYLHP